MNPPQEVTSRYSNSLLRDGKNDHYEISLVQRNIAQVDNIPVGTYYTVVIAEPTEDFRETTGIGATPIMALSRALAKAGVTFR